MDTTGEGPKAAAAAATATSTAEDGLPQKRHYRQRAHCNPLADHGFNHPVRPDAVSWADLFPAFAADDAMAVDGAAPRVEFLDVGCGYGGLLVELSAMFPTTLMLGLEIRVKVADYVRDRTLALRKKHPGQYGNINVLRTNAMKYLPNYFAKGQLTKMFFLYPDPHFKEKKHKWRIISPGLLAEYAYILAEGGTLYTVTDVVALHEWMKSHLDAHPLFHPLTEAELAADPVIAKLYTSTEEGQKVERNKAAGKNHGDGDVRIACYRRIADPGPDT